MKAVSSRVFLGFLGTMDDLIRKKVIFVEGNAMNLKRDPVFLGGGLSTEFLELCQIFPAR